VSQEKKPQSDDVGRVNVSQASRTGLAHTSHTLFDMPGVVNSQTPARCILPAFRTSHLYSRPFRLWAESSHACCSILLQIQSILSDTTSKDPAFCYSQLSE